MSTVYRWGEFGEQGARRLEEREALAKQQEERRRQVAAHRAMVPRWEAQVRDVDARLEEARKRHGEAVAASGAAWDALERACYYRQAGECHYSSEGAPLLGNLHPEVARENAALLEAQDAESKAATRVTNLEADKATLKENIARARGMSEP